MGVYLVNIMRCKQMFSVLGLIAPLAVGLVMASPFSTVSEASAEGTLTELCSSTVGACEPCAMEDAPVLRTEVCWDGRKATLKHSDGECAELGRPYHLDFGYVIEPISGEILPLLPLADTCRQGYCQPMGTIDPGTLDDGVACCNPKTGECSAPDQNGICGVGDVTWCKTLEDNGDGTVTCHE